MEATCSSETSVDFQRITWRYIPEDSSLQYDTYSYIVLCTDVIHGEVKQVIKAPSNNNIPVIQVGCSTLSSPKSSSVLLYEH
jgi:hypothetical protein